MGFLRKLRYGTTIILVAATGAVLSGCAGVTFFSDKSLNNETGIPIYAPKPYLLVSRTGAKAKPVEVSIVYLNDPNKVIYAQPHSGFGTSNLTLALANGQLTSFGQQTDTKLPELITSLGGFIAARGTASKTKAEAAQILAGIETKQAGVPMSETGKNIVRVANDMLARIAGDDLSQLTKAERQTVKSAAQALKLAGVKLSNPANLPLAQQQLQIVKAQTDALGKLPAPTGSTERDKALQLVRAWVTELAGIVHSAPPKKKAPPTFELYEIIQGDSPKLHRVNP